MERGVVCEVKIIKKYLIQFCLLVKMFNDLRYKILSFFLLRFFLTSFKTDIR